MLQIAAQTTKAVRLQTGRVIGPLPCAVQSKMTLDIFKGTLAIIGLPDYTSRQRGDVRSNAQMVPRKSNGPDTVAIALLQTVDFQNAHVFKGNWVTRRTGIQYHIRSEEHTSELQSLMRISYAVFCLTKQHENHTKQTT